LKSYLKTAEIEVEKLGGAKFMICELSARAQVELLELRRSSDDESTAMRSTTIACKHGVSGWADESLEDIEQNVTGAALTEIALAIYRLSGIELSPDSEKKSPSANGLSDDSSFDSLPT